MSRTLPARWRASAWSIVAAVALSACGGGGDDGPPPPTAIPESLSISAPAGAAEAGAAVSFGNSAASLAGLKYSWDFGDGSSASADASPSHSFAKGGDYEVVLRVSNEAGASRETRFKVTVNNTAHVKSLVCTGEKDSGWCWQQPRPTGSERNDVFFIDAKTGWTVGGNGEIFKTTDAGLSWTAQRSGIDTQIRAVRFLDANTGWALGDYGAVLRTTDGGATWRVGKIDSTNGNMPTNLTVFDAQTVIARDAWSGLFISTDGGQSWRASAVAPSVISAGRTMWSLRDGIVRKSTDLGLSETQLLDYRFTDSTFSGGYDMKVGGDQFVFVRRSGYAYVGGSYGYRSEYQRSRDGGASWSTPAMQGLPTNQAWYAPTLTYAGASGVLIVNWDGYWYRSTDGGDNWSRMSLPSYWWSGAGSLFTALQGKTLAFYRGGMAYISTDEGASWTAMSAPLPLYANADSRAIAAIDAQTLQLDMPDGASFRSADLGKTWTTVLKPTTSNDGSALSRVWAVDAKRVLALNGKGELLESKDGGLSWQTKLSGLYSCYSCQQKLFFASAKVGWMALGDGRVYRSADGGETWSTGLGSNLNFSSLHFVDETTGWALLDGKLMQSKDSGLGWAPVGTLPANVHAVRFRSAERGLAVSYYGLYETRDGGKSWTPRYVGTSGYLSAMAYADANNVWGISSSGGEVFRSTDGGETWTRATLPNAQSATSIYFFDASRGWIAGANGQLLATTDGGKTWEVQRTGTNRALASVQFVDSKTGWLMTSDGALLATGTGGK